VGRPLLAGEASGDELRVVGRGLDLLDERELIRREARGEHRFAGLVLRGALEPAAQISERVLQLRDGEVVHVHRGDE